MNTKIPPPIVTATFGLIIYFSKSFSPVYSFENSNMISVIFFLFVLGIFSAAVQSFKKHKTTINPLSPDKASSLVNSGIFSYSRNPMYLGMLLILLSVSFKFNISGGLFISFLFKIYITRFQIIPEEKAMAKLFGEEFITYKNQTRRWI